MAAKGEIAVEARQFTGSAVPGTEDKGLALFGRFEGSYRQSEWEARVRGFGRADYYDPKRNIAAAEEAFVQYRKGDWRVRLGADIVNWSATEAFHPADTLNARNFDSDIESFEKIGEPMLAVQWTRARARRCSSSSCPSTCSRPFRRRARGSTSRRPV